MRRSPRSKLLCRIRFLRSPRSASQRIRYPPLRFAVADLTESPTNTIYTAYIVNDARRTKMAYSLTYSQAILVVVYVADKVRQELYDYVPTRAIAASLGIPAPTTVKILHGLARAGIVETREGAKGGVRLAIPAQKISLCDVLEAMEQE